MKTEKRAQAITEKIKKITGNKTTAIAVYSRYDNSVQAELRLEAAWKIGYPVDDIGYPKNLAGDSNPLWRQMWDISVAIRQAAALKTGEHRVTIPINERTKTGPERRAEAKNTWIIEAGNAFLADYRAVTGKRALAAIRKAITDLQAQQKALLPQLRAANSAHLAGKKSEKQAQAEKNAEALKSGRFWEAEKETLKGYFYPPFDKNYLADVSEKWRAALFLECKSVSYRYGYDDRWGHKLTGTGRGHLCGIDDNGDEWGHRVNNLPQSHDDYGNAALDSTVEEAMADLFDIPAKSISACYRQGDLLFCPESIPAETKMTSAEKWAVRESHELWSPGLNHNGTYFKSNREILVSHTSHAEIVLPPGEYRLYTIEIVDAD